MRAHVAYRQPMLFACTAAVAAALTAPMVCQTAAADWKPGKSVEIVVPTSPGTGSDTTARWIQKLLADRKLTEAPASVVNKPGGAATLAVAYINQHPGDGHYFMVANPALLTSQITGASKITYTDTTPLAQIGTESVVFAVRADSPFKTARDLADRFKADPSKVTVAFANAAGNQNHIAAAQVVKSVGGDVRNLKVVVFGGSREGVTALLGGHVDVITVSASPMLQHLKAGKVRILAVSAQRRLAGELSTVPTWKELGVASVSSNWRALVGPRGMSEDQIRYWDQVFGKLVQLPEWKQDLEKRLVENTYLNARDLRKQMDAEYAEFTTVLTELGLAK